jgi:hypothetical protein
VTAPNLEFNYEQCLDPNGRWVYKFDHEPHGDGQWHRLNRQACARYCIRDGYLRFVDSGDRRAPNELAALLIQLDAAGLLRTDGAVEIVVRRKHGAFEMWSHWVEGGEGIGFSGFSADAWNDAYRRLRELEQARQ